MTTPTKKPRGRPQRGAVKQADTAALAGVAVKTLLEWRKEGIDITDQDQVMARADRKNERLASTEDKQAAELRKIRAQADKLEHELEIQRGKYVSHESQLKAGMQLGLVLKNIFLKMKGELTPRVAGRKASEVSKILDEYARAKLTELSHYDSDISIPTD
jgi:hypothetical protein